MFCLSCSHAVQRIFDNTIMHANHPFYVSKNIDATGKKQGTPLEAKVLLLLKTFAYGVVVPHAALSDYSFPEIMHQPYSKEYLLIPDECDLKDITYLD